MFWIKITVLELKNTLDALLTLCRRGIILSTAQRRAKMFKVENKTTGEVEICESFVMAELMVCSLIVEGDEDEVFINDVQYEIIGGYPEIKK